ncbi:MAG: glycosyltransferase [Cytophagaceae bacterium]|jgi:glycosyltransferase involved in cell wall biosynthesis|nr:glycosyltransferase [Cytophagaceae bacterium]
MPKVSVIIPTYKRAHYLKETLKNVHEQTFSNFEVIVVDDGTPGDENRQVCSTFPAVIYKKIENTRGPAIPRNEGVKLSKGEYIAFIDDDDLWAADKLERQVKVLDENPDFGLTHCCCKVIDSKGCETGKIVGRLRNPMRKHGYVFDDMIGNFTVMMITPLIRRELFDCLGGFNQTINQRIVVAEDVEFFTRLAFITKFYYIDEPLAYYRIHSNNISNSNFGYVYLPLEIFGLVKRYRDERSLSSKRFRSIRKKLLFYQIEQITDSKSAKVSKINIKKICPLYWTMPKVMISMIRRMQTAKQKR